MLHLKKEISHVPVRLLLQVDAKTIERHLPHACQEQIQHFEKVSATNSCKRRHAAPSVLPKTMHTTKRHKTKRGRALIPDSQNVHTVTKFERVRQASSTQKGLSLTFLLLSIDFMTRQSECEKRNSRAAPTEKATRQLCVAHAERQDPPRRGPIPPHRRAFSPLFLLPSLTTSLSVFVTAGPW